MDLNKYLNETAAPETQYSKEEYAAMKKAEREAVWVQVDARMGEVLADAPALQEFLNFMSQCRNSLPNQLLSTKRYRPKKIYPVVLSVLEILSSMSYT